MQDNKTTEWCDKTEYGIVFVLRTIFEHFSKQTAAKRVFKGIFWDLF